ncbi:hypothetical protein OC834_001162 [Tilletia horrida]|nr:hypothetical protein OC834_001162 [Tilletia horrida]
MQPATIMSYNYNQPSAYPGGPDYSGSAPQQSSYPGGQSSYPGGPGPDYNSSYPQQSSYPGSQQQQSSYPGSTYPGSYSNNSDSYGGQRSDYGSPSGGSGYQGQGGYQPPNHNQSQGGYQPPNQGQQQVQYDANGQPIDPATGERGLGTMAIGAMGGWAANKASGGHHGAASAIGGAIVAQVGKKVLEHFNDKKKHH